MSNQNSQAAKPSEVFARSVLDKRASMFTAIQTVRYAIMKEALKRTGGNIGLAAQMIDCSRNSIMRVVPVDERKDARK
jgi:DNA-binding NtrC family response regulator